MANRHLFLQAGTTSQYVGRIVDLQLAPVGIPGFLLAILTHVRDRSPISPTELSSVSGAPMTTLRDNIQRLVDGGLVRRLPHPTDGRSYRLELTARGERILRAADPALAEGYAALERLLPQPLADYQATVGELNAALERSLAELEELES